MVDKSVGSDTGVDDALSCVRADLGNIPLSAEVRALAERLAEALDAADTARMTMPGLPDLGQATGQGEHP